MTGWDEELLSFVDRGSSFLLLFLSFSLSLFLFVTFSPFAWLIYKTLLNDM